MQANSIPFDQLTYGVQLWALNCLYWDGSNYRFSRHHRAVEPAQRGRIAVTVNRALKRHFASPDELGDYLHGRKGSHRIMPSHSDLRGLLPRGATVSTFVTSETRSGDGCRLLVFAVVHGEIIPIMHSTAGTLGLSTYSDQVVISQPRARAGAELVRRLAAMLHGDANALRHQSIGEIGGR